MHILFIDKGWPYQNESIFLSTHIGRIEEHGLCIVTTCTLYTNLKLKKVIEKLCSPNALYVFNAKWVLNDIFIENKNKTTTGGSTPIGEY